MQTMISDLLISIIVPAYNRAQEIDEFLNSFTKQTAQDFEIVVVDDGSEDNLQEVVEKYKDKLYLRYYYQENQGPGAARNRGMQEANGDYFVFIDSDCTVPENYIENLLNHIKNENFDAFGGPDSCRDDFPALLKAINYSMTSFIGTGGTRGTTGKSVGKYYPRSFNMGIKREVYEKIGGMNELRHGQDMDFSSRIYKAGFKVKFFSDVVVFHKRRTNIKKFFKQIFNWGVTRINLGRLHKEMLKPIHCLPSAALLIFILTCLLSSFIPKVQILFMIEVAFLLGILVFVFFQASIQYSSILIGSLAIITILIQVVAYGLGFLTGVIKSIFIRKKFINGFTKKYYK